MSERKVLNKYYPPDFDPSKIPRLRLAKNRQYTVRIMAPCNMRCNTCGDYIAKAKKFNARKETVEEEEYLGLKVFRFYIKCPRCMAEITFKTDPRAQDYVVEHGATQNFMALKLAEEQAAREAAEKEEEMKLNPMKMLENRTKQSQREMAAIEELEELREINQRQVVVDLGQLINQKNNNEAEDERLRREEEEDEEIIRNLLHKKSDTDSSDSDDDADNLPKFGIKFLPTSKSTDMLSTSKPSEASSSSSQPAVSNSLSSESASSSSSLKRKIGNLVRIVNKKPATDISKAPNGSSVTSSTSTETKDSPSSNSSSQTTANKPPAPQNPLKSLCAYGSSDDDESDS